MPLTRRQFLSRAAALLASAPLVSETLRDALARTPVEPGDLQPEPMEGLVEPEAVSRWTRVNAGSDLAATVTSIVVDDSALFRCDDGIVVARTGEVMRVLAVNDGKTLTVERGVGTTAHRLFDLDWLLRLRTTAG